MPTAGRDRRREQRSENVERWRKWLTTAMAEARVEPKDLVNGSGGAIDKGSVSHWVNGENPASSESAIAVARVLRRDPVEALRAAGHEELADALAQSIADAAVRMRSSLEAELRAHLAGLDAEVDARLDRYLGPPAARGADEGDEHVS